MQLKKLGAAAVIFNTEGEVLLVKHAYRELNWELPGGGAQNGESVVQTAIREVREETGLEVIARRLSGIYFDVEADFHHLVFVCEAAAPSLVFEPNDEVSECAYWPLVALPRPMSDFTLRRIEDAISAQELVLPLTFSGRKWLE